MRGQYYREPSTRVVQPVVEMAADLPAGVDMSAHYLLDAITSASVASGAAGDNLFTEYRNEAGVSVGKTWSRLRLGAAYRYSAESDYWSHTVALSAALRVWSDTGTVAVSGGMGRDQVGRRVQGNSPDVAPPPGGSCVPSRVLTCPLDSVFAGVGYSQVLSPTLLVQGGYEVDGEQWISGQRLSRRVPLRQRAGSGQPGTSGAVRARRQVFCRDKDRVPVALPVLLGLAMAELRPLVAGAFACAQRGQQPLAGAQPHRRRPGVSERWAGIWSFA